MLSNTDKIRNKTSIGLPLLFIKRALAVVSMCIYALGTTTNNVCSGMALVCVYMIPAWIIGAENSCWSAISGCWKYMMPCLYFRVTFSFASDLDDERAVLQRGESPTRLLFPRRKAVQKEQGKRIEWSTFRNTLSKIKIHILLLTRRCSAFRPTWSFPGRNLIPNEKHRKL